MTTSPEFLRQELEKATSLVGTARRLLATGTMVDLAALEGRVSKICRGAMSLGREEAQGLCSGMETLIADLDSLAVAIRDRYDPSAASASDDKAPDAGAET
jgi:hypothetical protein